MLIYTGTKSTFMQDVKDDNLADIVESKLKAKMHRTTAHAEYRSWENSMKAMYIVLDDDDIPSDCGVAIEYNVPLTDKRVDFIISGFDAGGVEHADVIELKQWDRAEIVPGLEAVVKTPLGGEMRETTHPSYQVWSYAQLIRDYNASVQDKDILLHPCAYAHNYVVDGSCALMAEEYLPYVQEAPLFGKHEASNLSLFIKDHLKYGDDKKVLEDIDNGAIRPSKSLQDSLVGMLEGNPEFVLIDSQKVFFEKALAYAREAKAAEKNIVYIVQGGPGTGKSVLAINLLARLTADGQMTAYVSKNSAPRNVFSTKLKGTRRKSSIDALFRGSGAFVEAEKNSYDTLVVDEAHRLNEKSGLYSNLGDNQVKEIISAAWCSIFFIDESQRVTLKDIGTVREIKKQAARLGAKVYTDELASQFRCNGSDGYLAWLDDVLEIRETSNWSLEGLKYDFEVFDRPEDLERSIRSRNKRNKARIVAGYCWNWKKESKADASRRDIVIDDWGMSWNLSSTATYAIDDGSIDQAGCIHTVQGLEFDYVGVIVGPDMRYEDGHIVTDFTKRATTDKALSGIRKIEKSDSERAYEIADEIIKNTYRTLMTRGMKGCYVYCTDETLRDYLKQRVESYGLELNEKGDISSVMPVD